MKYTTDPETGDYIPVNTPPLGKILLAVGITALVLAGLYTIAITEKFY